MSSLRCISKSLSSESNHSQARRSCALDLFIESGIWGKPSRHHIDRVSQSDTGIRIRKLGCNSGSREGTEAVVGIPVSTRKWRLSLTRGKCIEDEAQSLHAYLRVVALWFSLACRGSPVSNDEVPLAPLSAVFERRKPKRGERRARPELTARTAIRSWFPFRWTFQQDNKLFIHRVERTRHPQLCSKVLGLHMWFPLCTY